MMDVNYQIALTHIFSRKKQSLIAAMGVTVGVALYIFSNAIVVGVSAYSKKNVFKSAPHIRMFNESALSQPLADSSATGAYPLITNPTFTRHTRYIRNPESLESSLRAQPFVRGVALNVTVDLFYAHGENQIRGTGSGIQVGPTDAMFDIRSTLLAGDLELISTDPNSIVIGKGVAEKLHVRVHDFIHVLSAQGVSKRLRVAGIFSTENKAVDDAKSYLHLNTAQQLLKENPGTVTDVYVQVTQPDSAVYFAAILQNYTACKVEDWQAANADQLAQNRMLGTMTPLISFSILLVAAFGIYNIINMTITQKMNDIAILKANGFRGRDIVRIFVSESLIMGSIGTLMGVIIGSLLVWLLSRVYVGPPIGYFPVRISGALLFQAIGFGLLVALGAGWIPARKAGKVDPVTIFRK